MKFPVRRIPIRIALLAPIAAFFLLLGLVDRALFRRVSEERLNASLNVRCADLSREVAGKMHQRFDTARLLVQSTLGLFRTRPELLRDPDFCRQVFLQQLRYSPSVHMIYFAMDDGAFLGVGREPDGRFSYSFMNPGDALRSLWSLDLETGDVGPLLRTFPYRAQEREWFRRGRASEGRPVWSDIYFYAGSPEFGITASQALRTREGATVGVFAVDDSLSMLSDFLREIRPTPNARVFLLESALNPGGAHDLVASSTAMPLVRNGEDGRRLRIDTVHAQDALLREAAGVLRGEGRALGEIASPEMSRVMLGGVAHRLLVVPYAAPNGPRWHLLCVLPERELVGDLREMDRRMLAVQAAFLIVLVLVASLVSLRFAERLRSLRDAALRRAEAGPEAERARLEPGPVAELADLSEAFNRMEARVEESFDLLERRVRERTTELSAANAQLTTTAEDLGLSRFLLDKAPCAACMFDKDGVLRRLNERFLSLYGYATQEEALGLSVRDFNPAITPGIWSDLWVSLSAKADGESSVFLQRHRRKDGSFFPVEVLARTTRYRGEIFYVAIVTDVTRREADAARLKRALAQADHALSLARAGYWSLPLDGGGRYAVSDRAVEITGIAIDAEHCALLSECEKALIAADPEAARLVEGRLRRVFAREVSTFEATYPFRRPADGRIVWLHSLATVLESEPGATPELFGVVRDVTAEVEARRELERARNAAESANRLKTEFLANMSHEIRTPMNAILGYAQLLRRDAGLPAVNHAQVETINRAGEHLLAIINDILEMSKIEAGRVTLNAAGFDLPALTEGLVELYGERARAKGLTIELRFAPGLPRFVSCDQGKLRQSLINLIGNAVKFTRSGGVFVEVSASPVREPAAAPEGAPMWELTFTVRDTGPGIAADELGKLFRPFVQASAGRRAGGTGLGLAISRQYAKLLGGDITVRSEPGRGSVFTLTVLASGVGEGAVVARRATPRALRLRPGHRPVRVLVTDDNAQNREVLAALLNPMGFTLEFATHGGEAVALFGSFRPHAILMDIRMPVMDGHEACRRIKALPGGPDSYIMALTASAFEENKAAVLASGADDFMRKPFDPDELLAVLGERLHLDYEYADEVPGAAAPPACERPTPGELAASVQRFPEDLAESFRAACRAADYEQLLALCDRLERDDAAASRAVRAMVCAYNYESLSLLFSRGR